jgi:hypothetical protein
MLLVNGEEFAVVCRKELAGVVANASQGDLVDVAGTLTPHHWKPGDGRERIVATIDATEARIQCPAQSK